MESKEENSSPSSQIFTENLCESIPLRRDDISLTNENEHELEEYPFDIDIEKKFCDSYYYRNEDPKKILKIRNYNITTAEICKDLVSKIQNQVVNKSESTREARKNNFAEDLKYIKDKKVIFNEKINTNPKFAIDGYSNLILDIEEMLRKVPDERMFETDSTLKEIIDQKKLIMSNLSLANGKIGNYRDAIHLDSQIIQMLDNRFDKSYVRLIQNYLKINDYNQAQQYANIFRTHFKHEVLQKYKDILDDFDTKFKQYEESELKKLSKKSKMNEKKEEEKKQQQIQKKEIEKEEEKKLQTQAVAKQRKKFLRNSIIGMLFMVGSGVGMFFLYKFRNHFLNKKR